MRTLFVATAVGVFATGAIASPPEKLVAHEWGTFTSFAGSDGAQVGFRPDNSALPDFVYRTKGEMSKAGLLAHAGTVSLETPVLYFYTDRETRASVRVDFPKGWVTEWYPFGELARVPRAETPSDDGHGIRWDVTLRPGSREPFPHGPKDNAYYRARETDAVPLTYSQQFADGRTLVQHEKFLFYRGVGTFPIPVTARALGGGKVRVANTSAGPIGGLVLVTVRGGKVGFRPLPELAARSEADAMIPDASDDSKELAEHLVKGLTAAGLYPKEARAMVRTWEAAWFGEDGTRLMYLVPRKQTDEILPLTVLPKPDEVARVLVGRHEFVTPEREAEADRLLARTGRNGSPEWAAFGRFAPEIRQMAEKRQAAGARAGRR